MARGGRREGAGRKPGSLEKRNRLIAETTPVTRERLRELSPLDIMLRTMWSFVRAADILGKRIVRIDEKVITQLGLLKRAAEIAKDAAPYMHAKKGIALDHNGFNGKSVQHHITVEIVDGVAPIP